MNSESKLIRMRAYRIIEIRRRECSVWIVLEDVERKLFRASSSGVGSLGVLTSDPNDTRDALIALRSEWYLRFSPVPINTLLPLVPADSIDRAIAKTEIRKKKLWEVVRQLRAGGSVPEDIRRASQPSDPPIMVARGEPPSDELLHRRLQQSEKELNDYGGGREMKWKSKGRTPAGRRCEVLTLDGSEEILVGEKSVELPSK